MQYEFRALQAERLVEVEAAKERYGMNEVNFRVTMLEYKRLFTTKALLHRLLIGASAQGLQQWTGINASECLNFRITSGLLVAILRRRGQGQLTAVIYYAPRIFEQIGLVGNTIGLLATGVVGIVNFVMTIPAVLFVDNFGRKPMLAIGEFNMAISHATIAAIIAVYGGRFGEHKAAGNGAVFMVYWYVPHLTT